MLTHKLAKRDIENKSASTVLTCLACQSYYNNIWSCLNNDHQRHKYPEPGSITKFKTYERTKTILFVIYADFECYIEGLDMVGQNPHKSSTTQYQKHNLSGFCYYIKCFDSSIYKPKLEHYTQQYEGEDITKKFVDLLEEELHDIYQKFKEITPIKMRSADIANYKNATKCYVCNDEFTPENYRVGDHCHYTGTYRGAAHT